MKVALAQIRTVTGDLKGNTSRILQAIKRAKDGGADIVVFPETAITGYCCGALFENEEFLRKNKQILEEEIAPEVDSNLVAVLGFVDFKGLQKSGFPKITNSAAIIQNKRIIAIYDKIILAGFHHHEDKRYFTPGDKILIPEVKINGKIVKLGTPICEDVWNTDHDRDIVSEMCKAGAELIVSLNQSYFYYGKQPIRRELFSNHSKRNRVPCIDINSVGVGDIVKNLIIYDGHSLAFDSKGDPLAELSVFQEDFAVLDLNQPGISFPALPSKYEEIFDALCFEQRELFSLLGLKKAQVHLSGGIDSAVVAAIAASAMGAENCVFISNPTNDNTKETKEIAVHIADSLGVKLYWNDTEQPYQIVRKAHLDSFGSDAPPAGLSSMQAVLRTVQGLAASHHFKSGILATGNHTEVVLGWASFHDIGSVGVHAPIGDLTKLEVYGLAAYINERFGKEIIPKALYDGSFQPRAELADSFEDPFDYYVMSGICAEIIRNRKGFTALIEDYKNRTLTPDFFPPDPSGRTIYQHCGMEEFKRQVEEAIRRSQASVFKSAQAAPTVIISPRSRGFSSRETIINKYLS